MFLAFVFKGDGFLGGDWRDIVAIVSIVVSVVGFSLAILAARSAADSARKANAAVVRNMHLVEATEAISLVNQVVAYCETVPFLAAVRISELQNLLAQIKETGPFSAGELKQFQGHVTAITLIRADLLARHQDASSTIDLISIHERLGELSEFLNTVQAKSKIDVGGSHGHPS